MSAEADGSVDTNSSKPDTTESLFEQLDLAMLEGDVDAVRNICTRDLVRYHPQYHGDHLTNAIASNSLSDETRDALYSVLSVEWSNSVDGVRLPEYLRLACSSGTPACFQDLLRRFHKQHTKGSDRASTLKGLLPYCFNQIRKELIEQEIKLAEESS